MPTIVYHKESRNGDRFASGQFSAGMDSGKQLTWSLYGAGPNSSAYSCRLPVVRKQNEGYMKEEEGSLSQHKSNLGMTLSLVCPEMP